MEFTFKPSIDTQTENTASTQGISTTPIETPIQSNNTVGLHFNNVRSTDTSMVEGTIPFATGLVTEPDYNQITEPVTVGLNVPVVEAPVANGDDEVIVPDEETIHIDHLLADDDAKIPQKFAVQSIPIDMDRNMLPDPSRFEAIANELNAHLSKANARPEFVTKKTNNWLSRLIDQRGEDYITSGKLSVDEVSRNADRIIDDMIAGRIDYTRQGQYLIMPVIIETLINYCVNKLAINKAIQASLGYLYNDYINRYNINPEDTERINTLNYITDNMSRNITQAISIVNQDIAIYESVCARLKYVQSTKNASSLFNLATELNHARKQMKKRY